MSSATPPPPPSETEEPVEEVAPGVYGRRVAPGEVVPFMEWEPFLEDVFDWQQGEHVTILGPTGQGKTYLALAILPERNNVVVLVTKPEDDTAARLIEEDGYEMIRRWPPSPPEDPEDDWRVVLWPEIDQVDELPQQKEVFRHALRSIYTDKKWCVFADELYYLVDPEFLGLRREVNLLLIHGRSLHISFVTATQRPRGVPLLAYQSATHLFFFRDNDKENLDRLGEIQNVQRDLVKETVENLPMHDVLYCNTRTGVILRTRVT